MRGALTLVLLLVGCGAQPIPVLLEDEHGRVEPTEVEREVLQEAFAFWGRDFELVGAHPHRGRAAMVTLTFNDIAPDGGVTVDDDGCEPSILVPPDAAVLRHELGHAWGLEHVDDSANLMHEEHQERAAERGMRRLLRCR